MPDRVKIAWFTPFHVDSAIGEFSRHVTAELARVADVEIWTSDDAPLLATDLPLVGYSPGSRDLDDLRSRDIVVYNLGNYAGYHRDIQAVSREHAGVVILHDRALHHLFASLWLMEAEPDPPRYIERMQAHYGSEGAEVARASLRGERPPVWESDEDVLRYPLYEESIVNALGVVTHSRSQADELRARWLGPVAALHLPCYGDVLTRARLACASEASARSRERGASGERLRLLTMGHLNPNKRVHKVIEILAGDPDLARKVQYRVVGSDGGFVTYSDGLRRQIDESPHLDVELLGWLPDDELEREMERTDIFVNLRHPNIEGGSASLMKQLAYGRPVVCFDSGSFGELPEGTVARVPVGDFEMVGRALGELASSVDRRKELGERARALAASYDERSYAEGLLALIEQSRHAAPALGCLDAVAGELGRMHVDSRLPTFDEIAKDFARILSL